MGLLSVILFSNAVNYEVSCTFINDVAVVYTTENFISIAFSHALFVMRFRCNKRIGFHCVMFKLQLTTMRTLFRRKRN